MSSAMSNAISGLSRPHRPDDRSDEPSAPSGAPFRREYALPPAAPRGHDAALVEFVRNATSAPSVAPPSAPRSAPSGPDNDRILYVGVNPESAAIEAAALSKMRRDTQAVPATRGDVVERGARSFDLATAGGRGAYVASLGLHGEVAAGVIDVLAKVSPGERGTVARIAAAWSAAERGEAIASRLVLSGHSTGRYVGGGGARLAFADVRALAEAMPRAGRQIEDVHISGCFSNGNARDETAIWLAAFPNMTTMWTYDAFAPGAPVHHLAAWEAATRGRQDKVVPAPWLRAQSVACWSRGGGYVDRNVSPEALERSRRAADAAFAGLMAGDPRIVRPSDEPAASHYRVYRTLANRLERADRHALAARADRLLALRSYESSVRGRFAETYASRIDAGFRAVGLDPPAFEALTRREALAESRRLREAIGRTSPAPAAAQELDAILRGLDALDPRIVKPGWSTHAE